MIIIYAILLSLCYVWGMHKGRYDLFSARFLFNAFAWVKNVPGTLSYGGYLSEEMIETYFFYKFLSFFFVNCGISIYESFNHRRYIYTERRISSEQSYIKIALLLLVCGLFMKASIISSAGGIGYILSHIQARKLLLAGQHYNQVVSSAFLTCSVLFSQYYYLKNKSKSSKILFWGIFIITLLSTMIFGARKPALMLVLQVLMFNHFVNRKYTLKKLLSLRSLIVVIGISMFMVMMPMLRGSAETDLMHDPLSWAKEASGSLFSVFDEFSYCAGDFFVFDYFSKHELWNGQTYLNILVQWIPSSIFPEKPPMDDGMYLWNMMNGYIVTPTTPTRQLPLDSSIPFTMEGALFANFGILGLCIGALLIGILYQKVYKVLIDTNCPIIMLIIYQNIMFVFVPSVLHTTSVIITCVLLGLIIYFLTGFRFKKL